MSRVKEEIKRVCKSTSVVGISKILNSKEIFLKVVWTFILLICTGILIYFISMLFIQYYKWPVISEFRESNKEEIVFPDITICSLNRVINDVNIKPLMSGYFNFIEKNGLFNFISDEDETKEFDVFYSLPALLRNLPKLNMLEKDCPNFITECILYGKDWQQIQTCTSNFTEVWNANYYSCFTIRTSQVKINKNTTIRGMTLVLNNGQPSKEQIPYDISIENSEGNGVRLAIHSPGTPPDLKRGFTLATGTENDVTLIQTNVERLDKPYNPHGCSKQKYTQNSLSEIYTRDHCEEYCYQFEIYKKCGCVAHWFTVPGSLNNISVCGNFSYQFFSEKLIKELDKLMCGINISENTEECDSCLIPCSEMFYSSYVVTTSWPQNSMQFGIYQKYILKCIDEFPKIRERYAAYDYLTNLRANERSENSNNKIYSFADLKEIGESFLVVKLIFEEDFPLKYIDKPLYTWDVLVGVVGGLMSLWLGISAVTIAELIELVYFIFKGCK